ncbi:MAG: hypothetical protein ACYDCK_02630 [Thermoplasmatota archaeon]
MSDGAKRSGRHGVKGSMYENYLRVAQPDDSPYPESTMMFFRLEGVRAIPPPARPSGRKKGWLRRLAAKVRAQRDSPRRVA